MLYKLCKDRLGNLLYHAYSVWCLDNFVDWHSKALFHSSYVSIYEADVHEMVLPTETDESCRLQMLCVC